ncbi:MAG: ATPase [Arcobacter sp.]|nr:MAG: ATPase [Arcobacter sp.]
MSGNITANIQSIVDNLDHIEWKQAIYEAITNSLHANATEINITFKSDTLDYENTKKKIDEIIISDNGEGFNNENTEAFQEYGTQHKKIKHNIGAKGVGRFLYLKVFDSVYIESLDKEIKFSVHENIVVNTLDTKKYSSTKVYFKKPNIKLIIDYSKLKTSIQEHFIAYFKLLNTKEVDINIYENNEKQLQIKSSDIPEFKTKEFKVNKHSFTINYVFNNKNYNFTEGFYCADNRVVIKNSDLDQKKKLKAFQNINILFLLSSEYLNNNVDSTRANFTIMPLRTSQQNIFQDTSWQDIQIALKKEIKKIADENKISIDKIAKENLEESLIIAPYLSYYLKSNEDVYSVETLLDNAKKALEEDKKTVRDDIEDNQRLLNIITQAELAEYIFDRQLTIDKLKKLTDEDAIEKEIHNLFMKQYTKDEKEDYRSNNLWLFDDRFMSYNKVFSEAQLKDMFPKLIDNLERPDILSIGEMNIISNTYKKNEITDIVIIELKKASDKITPARAEEQLIDYAGYINEAYENTKIRIWTYAFLKFDEKTENSLKNKDYNRVLTKSKYPIYYKPFNAVNTIINFIDYHALADDAHNRNKTFMKILKGKETVS